MIYCEYNKHFKKLKQKNRIISLPILKNTCVNCKYKNDCGLTKLNNTKKNNEIIIKNLLQLKDYIEECILEYKRIEYEIKQGLYDDTYTHDLIRLEDVPNKNDAITYHSDSMGVTEQYTVKEYLEKFPQDSNKKKLVGIRKVETVSDVVSGLNIQELEEDLEYINEELRRMNKNNKIIKRSF